jgi:hypothetical protein
MTAKLESIDGPKSLTRFETVVRSHHGMKPIPANENQATIAAGIDAMAAIVAEAGGQWDGNRIRNGMAATQSRWTEADHDFFDRYLRWRSRQYSQSV